MKLTLTRWLGVTTLGLCMAVAACKKNDSPTAPAADTSTSDDYTAASSESDNVSNLSDNLFANGGSGKNDATNDVFVNCITISGSTSTTVDTTSASGSNADKQHSITVNFNGSCGDGKNRSGSITFSWNGRYAIWRNPNRLLTITSNNYTVNGNKWQINKQIHSYPSDANGGPFNVVTENDSITYTNGQQAGFHTLRKEQWTAGYFTTPFFHLDQSKSNWQITVTGNDTSGGLTSFGVNRKGEFYTITIPPAHPIILYPGCLNPFDKGQVLIQDTKGNSALVDYGDGSCSGTYTVSINGGTPVVRNK